MTLGTNASPVSGTRLVPAGLLQENAGTMGWSTSGHLKHLQVTVYLFDIVCYKAYRLAAAINIVVEFCESNPIILKTKYFP